jgi:glucose dehydrogenase
MSLTRILIFLIGLVVSGFGLLLLLQFGRDPIMLVAGLASVIIGVWILSGKSVSI